MALHESPHDGPLQTADSLGGGAVRSEGEFGGQHCTQQQQQQKQTQGQLLLQEQQQQREEEEEEEEEEQKEKKRLQLLQRQQQSQQEQRQQCPSQLQNLQRSACRRASSLLILDVLVEVYMRKDFWKLGVVWKGGLAATSVMSHMQSGRGEAVCDFERGRSDEMQEGWDERGSGLRQHEHEMGGRVQDGLGKRGSAASQSAGRLTECADERGTYLDAESADLQAGYAAPCRCKSYHDGFRSRGDASPPLDAIDGGKMGGVSAEGVKERGGGSGEGGGATSSIARVDLHTGPAVPGRYERYRWCDVVGCEVHGGVIVGEVEKAKARAAAAGRCSLGAIFRSLPRKEEDGSSG